MGDERSVPNTCTEGLPSLAAFGYTFTEADEAVPVAPSRTESVNV